MTAYPVILPIFGHTLVAYTPHPRITCENVGRVLIAVIVLAPLRIGIRGHPILSAMIRLVLGLILEILLVRTGSGVHLRGTVLLRPVMPAAGCVVRLPTSGGVGGLDVIVASVTTTEMIPLPLRIGDLAPAVGLVMPAVVRAGRPRLDERRWASIIVRLRGPLIRHLSTAVVMLKLMLRFRITLKSRWFVVLLRVVDAAVVLRIRRRGDGVAAVARRSLIVSVLLRVSRRGLITAATPLTPVRNKFGD